MGAGGVVPGGVAAFGFRSGEKAWRGVEPELFKFAIKLPGFLRGEGGIAGPAEMSGEDAPETGPALEEAGKEQGGEFLIGYGALRGAGSGGEHGGMGEKEGLFPEEGGEGSEEDEGQKKDSSENEDDEGEEAGRK